MWLEIELSNDDQTIRVSGRGSRGERPPPHTIPAEKGADPLQTLSNKITRAVRGRKALDEAAVSEAQALYQEVFQGELRDVLARLGEVSKDGPLLVRLFMSDRALQSMPWEALCRPGTTEGFLGTDTKLLVARGVLSSEPWEPREVRSAVRVLAIAPGSDESALLVLRDALGSAIEDGEIDWLDPIAGDTISPRNLFDRLRRGKSPHIVHWLGHGSVDLQGRPVLRVADDEDGEEVWITAESLARELGASFSEELRLIILEACEGAKAGAFGSAAEILAKAGADAVVAHLWPVKADTARTCSTALYRALTGADRSRGDIGAAVSAARRTLLAESAEAFSPTLYLRGSDSVIFSFEGRRVVRPSAKRKSKGLAPALQGLLEKPFTLVLGDLDEDRASLARELSAFLKENGDEVPPDAPLVWLTQRCALRFGQEILHSLFQQAHGESLTAPPPPLVEAMGRLVGSGVHITLLWQPHLERAVAAAQPQRTLYVIQPPLLSSGGKPRIIKRQAGAAQWKMEPILPKRFDLDNDIVVIRLYGGYSPEARPIFQKPLLTEDDYINGLLGIEGSRMPDWMAELLAQPRLRPALFVGLSVLDWRHRALLRGLYDQRPAPEGSLAMLWLNADPKEPEIWGGSGEIETGRIAVINEDPAQLAQLLLDAAASKEAV
jgi:CHAT domain-containing protein